MSSSSITHMALDMWREILVRLPAESLFRSRAVSKGWRAVIDDPCFVRAHTNHQQQKLSSSSKIIFQNMSAPATPSFYSLDLEALSCSSNGQQAVVAMPLDLDFFRDDLSFRVSECNGLVFAEEPAFTIMNPFTHERLDLPRGDFSKKRSEAFGLGYDSTTYDYKAVVILKNRQTHVYSLKLDTWRRIMDCPCDARVGLAGVFVCGGGLNWLSRGDKEIVVLDLGTEKYSVLQMPPLDQTRRNNPYIEMRLNVLGGCLALCDSGFCSHLDVWEMKKLGSWTKLFSIDWKQNISVWASNLRPVAFIMKKEEKFLVFLQDSCQRYYLFDVETTSLKSVEFDGSIIRKDLSYSYAKQMVVGSVFRLHANCGGGVRKMATNCSNKKRKAASASADEELVFCLTDAKKVSFCRSS